VGAFGSALAQRDSAGRLVADLHGRAALMNMSNAEFSSRCHRAPGSAQLRAVIFWRFFFCHPDNELHQISASRDLTNWEY
jgi:hypothetical protein